MPNIVEPALISTPNSGRPAMAQVEAQRHLEAYGGGRHSVDTAYNGLRVWQNEVGKAQYHFERGGTTLVTKRTLDTPSDAEDAPADLVALLKHPNPWQTFTELVDYLLIDLLLVGNHYWLKFGAGADGRPQSLYRLAPQYMQVVPGERALVDHYEYKLPGETQPMLLAARDVVHFKLPNPHSPGGILGMGLVQAGARGFDIEIGLVDAQANFFENGTLLAGVINSDRAVPEPLRRKIVRQFKALYGGSSNFYNVAVLERGLKYQPIQPNANDAAFDTLGRMSRDRILTLLGVPALLAAVNDDSRTQITYEDAKLLFSEGFVRPLLDRLQSRLSMVLTQAWAVDFIFDYEYVLPESTRLQNATNFAKLPGVRVREIRQKMGLEALGPAEKTPDGKPVDDMILNVPGVSTEVPGGTPDNLPGQTNGGGRPANPDNIPAFQTKPVHGRPPSASDDARRRRHAANTGAGVKAVLPELAVVDRLLELRARESLEAGVTGVLLEGKALKKSEREALVGRVQGLPLWALYRGVRERVVNAIAEGVRRGYTVDQILDGVPGENFDSVRELLRRLEVPDAA